MAKQNYLKIAVLSIFVICLFSLIGIVSAQALYGNSDNEIVVGSDSAGLNSRTSVNSSNSMNSSNERERVRAHILSRINARTGLNLSEDDVNVNSSNGAILRVYMSNGRYAYVRVMPDRASLTARENMRARCEANNCTFELREVSLRNETRAAYRVRVEKDARVLGLFRARMNVDVDVDADTGEVIQVHRPWWASISSEEDVEVN